MTKKEQWRQAMEAFQKDRLVLVDTIEDMKERDADVHDTFRAAVTCVGITARISIRRLS